MGGDLTDSAAFFCSKDCPGDLILKAQDWANARGPESAPVIGGFHTPIERDVLRILLRGAAPVTIVLARAVRGYRASPALKVAVAAGSARIISPFPSTQTRTTAATAETRNRYILTLCSSVLFAHAAPDGKTESLARDAAALGLPILSLNSPANANLIALGAEVV
jgi:predicted Rossmann fold nucleotide-binding protein DprA/Smf involved in DNA uptake